MKMKNTSLFAMIFVLAAAGSGWWLMKKRNTAASVAKIAKPSGPVAESKAREQETRRAIQDFKSSRQTGETQAKEPAKGGAPRQAAAGVSASERRYMEALRWVSQKALKSPQDQNDLKNAWADPAFLAILSSGLGSQEISTDSNQPVAMIATSLLVNALNNPATFAAAESVILKHLREVRIEDLQKSQPKEVTLKMAEDQGELLYHWSAQAKDASLKVRELERVSPSQARKTILANVQREHRNNLALSMMEMKLRQ